MGTAYKRVAFKTHIIGTKPAKVLIIPFRRLFVTIQRESLTQAQGLRTPPSSFNNPKLTVYLISPYNLSFFCPKFPNC